MNLRTITTRTRNVPGLLEYKTHAASVLTEHSRLLMVLAWRGGDAERAEAKAWDAGSTAELAS